MISFGFKKITFYNFFNGHNTGIYGTVIVHLAILAILLSAKLYSISSKDLFFLFDFSELKASAIVEATVQSTENKREVLMQELEQRISGKSGRSDITIRNVAVNVAAQQNEALKDDRNTDAAKLYQDAKLLQNKLNAARQQIINQQGVDNIEKSATQQEEIITTPYQGASVLSYDLGGRAAMSLPVPAYQCENGGDIKVLIEVDKRGYVKKVRIDLAVSSTDRCIQEAAQAMAQLSRFVADANASEKQNGFIIYRFVPQ